MGYTNFDAFKKAPQDNTAFNLGNFGFGSGSSQNSPLSGFGNDFLSTDNVLGGAGSQDFLSSLLSSIKGFGSDATGTLGDLGGGLLDNSKGIGELLSGLGGLGQAYTGFKTLGIAEDELDFNKGVFNTNLANQAKSINSQLEDRQRSRIASTGDNNASGNYESLKSYMDKNAVSGKAIG